MEDREGYWIATKRDKTHYQYNCSVCGFKSRFYKSVYCAQCGARMNDCMDRTRKTN